MDKSIEAILNTINFIKRYELLSRKFNNYEDSMSKIDNKEVLSILKEKGYDFKYTEGHFVFKEIYDRRHIHLALRLKYGVLIARITIYDGKDFLDLESGNFVSIHKKITNSQDGIAPRFSTYSGFKDIINEILSIYEDIKKEFLALVEKEEKLKEK